MAKTIQLVEHTTTEELQHILKTTKDEGKKTRIKILLHIQKGLSRKTIAEKLSVNVDTITDIVKRYNTKGIQSLDTNKGGRPEGNRIWDIQIFEDLKTEINTQKEYWSIPKMMQWITKHKKKDIPETTVWYNMTHSMAMSFKSARPHPHLGDKEKQEVFKKKA